LLRFAFAFASDGSQQAAAVSSFPSPLSPLFLFFLAVVGDKILRKW
jgi:hypothetical protein